MTRFVETINVSEPRFEAWVYRQYDHMVRTNTAVLPGADAAVVRIKETRRALAMTLDGNGRYCAANPRAWRETNPGRSRAQRCLRGARPLALRIVLTSLPLNVRK